MTFGGASRNQLPLLRRIPLSLEAGLSSNIKFGNNSVINTTSTPEDVWEGGGLYTGQPVTGAETVDVFSASTADTAAGTGARTVQIQGLDANFAPQSETVTLAGTTLVTSAGTYGRVFCLKVLTAGSGGANAGILTVHHTTTTANIFIAMPVGSNQSRVAAFTVPVDKQILITRLRVSLARANGSAGSATVSLRCRPPGSVYQAVVTAEITTQGPIDLVFDTGLTMAGKSDLKVHVEDVSDNGTFASGIIEYLEIDEDA